MEEDESRFYIQWYDHAEEEFHDSLSASHPNNGYDSIAAILRDFWEDGETDSVAGDVRKPREDDKVRIVEKEEVVKKEEEIVNTIPVDKDV